MKWYLMPKFKLIQFTFRYYKAIMGRPARNHGGTGGHGCHPLPGERPNFHHHIVSDKTLQKMVKNAIQGPAGRCTKLEILKYIRVNEGI